MMIMKNTARDNGLPEQLPEYRLKDRSLRKSFLSELLPYDKPRLSVFHEAHCRTFYEICLGLAPILKNLRVFYVTYKSQRVD